MPSTDPDSDPPPARARSFGTRLQDGWERAREHLPLAAIPAVSSLLAIDNVRRVLSFHGYHFGVTFRFPSALPDLWTFVSLPSQGSGIHVSPTLFVLPVLILARAVLVAGLLGSVHEILRTGRYDFAGNVRRYFVPVVGFVALVRAVELVAFTFVAAVLPLALALLPVFFVLSYLFYATPYLLVVADLSVGEALGRSYEWAVSGGPYFSYGAGYLLFVAVVSLVGTVLVVNSGAVGVLVGTLASAPVALALAFATTEFVVEMIDAERGPPSDRTGPV